jgi:hypothetical protein
MLIETARWSVSEGFRGMILRLSAILVALSMVAAGMLLWGHADWVAGPENASQDGTCRGVEEAASRFLSLATVLLSPLAPWLSKWIWKILLVLAEESQDPGGAEDIEEAGSTPRGTIEALD